MQLAHKMKTCRTLQVESNVYTERRTKPITENAFSTEVEKHKDAEMDKTVTQY